MRHFMLTSMLFSVLVGLLGCGAYYDGNRAMERGDVDAAIAFYQQAIGENPSDIIPRRALGRAYFAKGDYDQARKTFEDLLAMAPGDWVGTFFLGLTEVAQGQRQEGIDTMLTVTVPFYYYTAEELRCSVRFVAAKKLSDKDTVDLLLVYLKEVERRQAYRQNSQRGGENNALKLPLECPPMLGRILYIN